MPVAWLFASAAGLSICGLMPSMTGRRPNPTEDVIMPERKTVERARADKRHGKAASTQAGNFVKEEMDHIREGKHGAKTPSRPLRLVYRRHAARALPSSRRGRQGIGRHAQEGGT